MQNDAIQALADALTAMNNAAVAARAGSKKTRTLSSRSARDWRNWRLHFEDVARINGWNNQRQKREIRTSMEGEAFDCVKDIDVEDANLTPANVLDRYEARFVVEAASQLARSEFVTAKQGADESVLAWHGRLRELYLRAYPNRANDLNADLMIVDRFVLGLSNPEIKREVIKSHPDTFQAALESAQARVADYAVMIQEKLVQAPAAGNGNGVHAMGPGLGRGRTGTCHFCEQTGHFVRECNLFKKAKAMLEKEGAQGNGGQGRGQEGSASGRGGFSSVRGRGRTRGMHPRSLFVVTETGEHIPYQEYQRMVQDKPQDQGN